jgi:cytochrome b involved in lipid metabolism
VVDNSVYDVTNFITDHPGGEEILKGCGKDATSLFKGQPKHGGPEAQSMLPTLKIGEITQ